MKKIAVIGAGSAVFSKNIIADHECPVLTTTTAIG